MFEALYLQLSAHDDLSDSERSLLANTIGSQREFAEGEDLVSEGSRPAFSTLLLDGLAARYK